MDYYNDNEALLLQKLLKLIRRNRELTKELVKNEEELSRVQQLIQGLSSDDNVLNTISTLFFLSDEDEDEWEDTDEEDEDDEEGDDEDEDFDFMDEDESDDSLSEVLPYLTDDEWNPEWIFVLRNPRTGEKRRYVVASEFHPMIRGSRHLKYWNQMALRLITASIFRNDTVQVDRGTWDIDRVERNAGAIEMETLAKRVHEDEIDLPFYITTDEIDEDEFLPVDALVYSNVTGSFEITHMYYDPEEEKLYVPAAEYRSFKVTYGKPRMQVPVYPESISRYPKGYEDYQQQSLLNALGYNVNQNDNLSDEERREILSEIMDKKFMKKNQVLRYLNWYIDRNSQIERYEKAVAKWTRDRAFVRSYRVSHRKYTFLNQDLI